MIIGLTGGIGSGKSTVARAFETLGAASVDADDVAREIVLPGEPALLAIKNRFGDQVMHHDGTLNRAALRDIIFKDPEQRQWLESVTHPKIRERLLQHLAQLKTQGAPYVLLVSPLLFESGQNLLANRAVVVDVPQALQLSRTQQRDGVSESQVHAILAAQLSREQRLAQADDVIDNSGDHASMMEQVVRLDQRYRQLLND
ncbi:dephospho-CoA kinase [Halomonas sp. NYA30]